MLAKGELAKGGGGLNDLLIAALKSATLAGDGDEEPEVLPPPEPQENGRTVLSPRRAEGKDDEDGDAAGGDGDAIQAADKGKGRARVKDAAMLDEEEANRLMEEEERRVAALSFDPDALLPFENMAERAKYIPLRLSYEERKSLRMVKAAIGVSDYTNTVDVDFGRNKARRKHVQLQQIVAFLTGLVASTSYEKGQELLADRNFETHEDMLQTVLEVARRYKITNPEKMRSEYGKLVYLMQDAVSNETNSLLGVNVVLPVKTVYALLERKRGLKLLEDPALGTATQEILPLNKDRHTIQNEIKRKEKAAADIVKRHTTNVLKEDDIRLCLYSIGDNNSFLNSNRKPITDCIALLEKYFHHKGRAAASAESSLSINEGQEGARLSHSHETQYNYVLQSLHLWAAIIEDTFRLWSLAEQDLLSPSQPYELRNTGQGLQRVQQSPRVYKAMHEILSHTQHKLGSWVGSSVIHLGDNNVANALNFIDKYTQVARILGPLVTVLNNLDKACAEDAGIKKYMLAYGGIDKAKRDILRDFFTHGFDGSGGDNFFDAGSCIDGRLTR
jgi:hypothetical protein